MKSFLFLASLLISAQSFAGSKFICKEITENEWDQKRTMILTQEGDERVEEGTKYNFKLEVYDSVNSKPLVSEKVVVQTEDVLFQFSNKAKRIDGIIYMDEPDQTVLTIGKTKINFNCY